MVEPTVLSETSQNLALSPRPRAFPLLVLSFFSTIAAFAFIGELRKGVFILMAHLGTISVIVFVSVRSGWAFAPFGFLWMLLTTFAVWLVVWLAPLHVLRAKMSECNGWYRKKWFYAVVLTLGLVPGIFLYSAKKDGRLPLDDIRTWFGYSTYSIPTGSMEPTISLGDFLLTRSLRKPFKLRRGMVVTFTRATDRADASTWIKRIVGLPGESIRTYTSGRVAINGQILSEPYINKDGHGGAPNWRGEVPAGYVFVMGDNRKNSSDSRVFGPVPIANLLEEAETIWLGHEYAHGLSYFSGLLHPRKVAKVTPQLR